MRGTFVTSITVMSNNKKTPVKKSTTKKEVAKKTVAKKAPVKKAAAKKTAPAKKVATAKVEEESTSGSFIDDVIDRAGLSRLVAEASEVIDTQKADELISEATTIFSEAINNGQKKIKFWRRILGIKAK